MTKSTREVRLYPNRRLYDPHKSRYIKYEDVYALVRQPVEVKILDQRHGTDRTHDVLVDLIVRQEVEIPVGQAPVFTEAFLRDLIRMSATEAAPLVARFLDHTARTLEQAESAHKSAASRETDGI